MNQTSFLNFWALQLNLRQTAMLSNISQRSTTDTGHCYKTKRRYRTSSYISFVEINSRQIYWNFTRRRDQQRRSVSCHTICFCWATCRRLSAVNRRWSASVPRPICRDSWPASRLPWHSPPRDLKQMQLYLTLSSPVLSNGTYTSKGSGPYWSNPPFKIFLTLGHSERQSSRMSQN